MSSAIKHIPLAGRDVSLFIQQMLRDRNEPVSPEDSLDVARHIKESLCYTSPDIATEFAKYDADALKSGASFKQLEHKGRSVDVGYERFLAPEIFFNPEIAGVDVGAPLPELVDSVIQSCPIDGRRGLYSVLLFLIALSLCVQNIALSGGSTMFKGFSKRLQRDIKSFVDARLQYTTALQAVNRSSPIVVNVVSHAAQRYAVWSGGSLFASMVTLWAYCCLYRHNSRRTAIPKHSTTNAARACVDRAASLATCSSSDARLFCVNPILLSHRSKIRIFLKGLCALTERRLRRAP